MDPLPACLSALWEALCELRASASGGLGVAPISLRDVQAYSEVYGVEFSPWEVETLLSADASVMVRIAEQTRKGVARGH